MSEENMEIVRRAFEAAMRKPKPDFAAVNALFDPDHVMVSVISAVEGRSFHGARGFREWLSNMDQAFDSWEASVSKAIDVDDERILVAVAASGYSKRAGVPFAQELWLLSTVRNGRIVRSESFESESKALKAAGLSE